MIIGITGNKFNGKDTLADLINLEYNYKKISFADPLKQITKILFNFSDEQLYGSKKETIDEFWNITPRETFQYLGTDIFRNRMNELIPDIDNNFWLKCMEQKFDGSNIVIPDVRFENERELIKKYNGVIIKIVNPNIQNNNLSNHESENNNIDYDYLIINNGSIDDLKEKIFNLGLVF